MIAQHLFRLFPFGAIQLFFLFAFFVVGVPTEALGAGNGHLSWTANTEPDLAGYEIYFGDQDNVYNHPDSPVSVGLVTSYDFAPGTFVPGVTYYFALKAKDVSNNLSFLSDQAFGGLPPDTTLPSVSITSPTDGSNVSGIVLVSATASDSFGIEHVQFFIDGNPFGSPDTSEPYQIIWDSSGLTGSHTLSAQARDNTGLEATTPDIIVTIVPLIFSLTINLSGNGSVTSDIGTITCPGVCTDNYAAGTLVTLTAQADPDSDFSGWSGAGCSGTGSCVATIDQVQTVNAAFSVTGGSGSPTTAWTAADQNPGESWVNSGWDNRSFRILLEGPSITVTGSTIQLTLRGRSSGSYTIQRVSLVHRDGNTLNGVDSSFRQVTFGGTWDGGISVPAGGTVTSDPIVFDLISGQDVFLTFWVPLGEPTSFLDGSAETSTWIIKGSDNSGTIDWAGLTINNTLPLIYVAETMEVINASSGGTNPLTVSIAGSGTVTSDIGTITCPGVCTDTYADGTTVTLTAQPNLGSTFDGWSGASCTGTGLCVVTMDQSHSVIATFENAPPPPDTTPPTVDITNPSDNEEVSGIVPINASASDNIGVEGVRFLVNGVAEGVEDTTAPYSINWDTTSLLPNSYMLKTIARDAAGNETMSAPISVSITSPPIDNSFPSVSITAPTSGSNVSGIVSITANASDNVGIVGVRFFMNGTQINVEDLVAPYSTQWDTTALPLGTYNLTAIARDAASNETTSTIIAVNTIAPPTGSLELTNLVVGSGNPYETKIDSLHNGEMVYIDRSYTFTNVPGPLTGETYIQTANNDKGSTGNNFLSFSVNQQVMVYVGHDNRISNKPSWLNSFTDTGMDLVTSDTTLELYSQSFPPGTVNLGGNAGNGKSMYSVVVTPDGPPVPDTTPPTVDLTAPTEGQEVSGVVTLNATAADNIGITSVRFLVNGIQIGAEDIATPYSIQWDTTPLTPASYQLTAIAKDTSFNETTSATITVSIAAPPIDNSVPSVSITSPTSGSNVSGIVSINATASDNVGVVGVRFFRDTVLINVEDIVAPYSTQWDTTSLPLGTYNLTAIARDAAGNETTSTIIPVNTIDPPTGPLNITNLSVGSGKTYEVKIDSLQNGKKIYIDRSYTFTNVPGTLTGATYIKTANNDKNSSGMTFLSFSVDQPVTVYVGHDVRLTNKPAWLTSYTDTGMNLVTSDTTLELYSQTFPAGTVVLGGNNGQGKSMYSIVVTSSP